MKEQSVKNKVYVRILQKGQVQAQVSYNVCVRIVRREKYMNKQNW